MFEGEDLIYAYTREQALDDGHLVDVSETAWEAGFRIPVALSAGVWEDVNAIPESRKGIEDWQGRLWDLLWMTRAAVRNAEGMEIVYRLIMPVGRKKLYDAKLHVGPGDDLAPVATILRPGED